MTSALAGPWATVSSGPPDPHVVPSRRPRQALLVLRIGERSFEIDDFGLRSSGTNVSIGPTALRLLTYLARNHDRIVTTDELLREVWSGVRVTTSSVQQGIRALRKALANGGAGATVVRTVRAVGYQLAATVEVVETAPLGTDLPFVGRDSLLARLLEALESTRAGQEQLVLVSGPPGIGKTRLLRELEVRATGRGFLYVCGRCPEGEGAAALWPWEEVLRSAFERRPSISRDLAPSDRDTLEAVFPGLTGGSGEAPALDPGSARLRLHEAVRRVLMILSQRHPLVVAFDDLHNAEESSVRLLEWVAARRRGASILLVAAFRELPAQRDGAFRSLLGSLQRQSGTRLERLANLSWQDVEEVAHSVLGTRISPEEIRSLWSRSGGNPFFLKVLVDHLRAGWRRGRAGELLPAAYESVRTQLGDVSPRTRELLGQAAVLGREVDPPSIGALTAVPAAEVALAIEEARAAGLIERGSRGALRFAHALVVEALYDPLDAKTRSALHARAVEMLEPEALRDETLLGALAEHAWRAVPSIEPERAAGCCDRAARAAFGRYAFEEAARLHARSLELTRDAGPDRRLAQLLELGECRALAGQAEAAADVLGKAIQLARATGDAEALGRAVLALAVLRGDETQVAEPGWIRELEEAVHEVRGNTPLRAQLLSRLAAAVWRLPPAGRAPELARESVRLARQCTDPAALASVLTRAYRILQTGPGDDALRAELAGELERAAEDTRDTLVELNARVTLLWQSLLVGDRPAFDENVARIVQQAEAVPSAQARWHGLMARTSRAVLSGDLELAERLAEQSLTVGEAGGVRIAASHHLLQRFAIRWAQGRLGELEPELAVFAAQPFYPWSWRVARRLAGLATGHSGPARELLRTFGADPDQVPRDVVYADVVSMLGQIAAELEDREAAELLVPRLEELRGRHWVAGGSYCHLGTHERPLGCLLAMLGRFDEAVAALEAALRADRRLGSIPAASRDQHDLAMLLIQRARPGDRERARGLLAESESLGRALGSGWLERSSAEALARL